MATHQPIRKTFSVAERAAIAELVEFAQVCGSSTDEGTLALGALMCERAANIIRGEAGPYAWDDAEVLRFARFWRIDQRAKFNPKPKTSNGPKTTSA